MTLKYRKQMQWIALAASIVIGIQTVTIFVRGNAFCLNTGCKVVESLTAIPPLYFNMAGLLYFLVLFTLLRWFKSASTEKPDLPRLLLFAGMAVESVLLAYQITVVHVVCAYCLFIFVMVLLLNILGGMPQLVKSIVMIVAVNIIFMLLNFGPSMLISQHQSLAAGTYATSRCSDPTKELFLIFSEDCPHCINVIHALEQCNSCDFHFNPIDRITSLDLPNLEISDAYDPEINRVILSLLDIQTVPALLVKNPDGYSFVHGENNIIRYIESACFKQEHLFYMDSKDYTSQDDIGMSIYDEEDGECEVTVDCD